MKNLRFKLYVSGVEKGTVIFGEEELSFCPIDERTGAQLKENLLSAFETDQYMIAFNEIHKDLDMYESFIWEGDKIQLPNGRRYNKYLTFTGQVIENPITSQLWARRGLGGSDNDYETNVDIVTAEGKVIAFVSTGRIAMNILVLEGYESVTPLTKYEDDRLSSTDRRTYNQGVSLVETRDGVKLATEVVLPYKAIQGEKVPALVIRTCYGRDRDVLRAQHWANYGYAVVIQDVRGRSDSDGELIPFAHEREDAYDLFDWIIEQPWNDGKIGMWGASYLGYTTTAAATSGHPNLVTAISEVNVGSPFYDTARRGGTICSWPLLSWTLAQSVSNRTNFGIFAGALVDPDVVCKTRPIRDIPKKVLNIESPIWDRWADHYYYDDFWRAQSHENYMDNVKIPMLIMSGWYDGDALGVQETWRLLEKHDVPDRRIIIGPWPHGLNAFRDCRDLEFGDNAIDYDFDTRIIRWFDHYIKGIDNGENDQPRASYYVVGENKWRTSNTWNPSESTLVNLYLTSEGRANSLLGDGKILLEPKEDTGHDTYIYDPLHPVGDEGSVEPYHCNHIQVRQDTLCYDTEPLKENVAVAGNFYSEFYASSSAVDTDFIIRVSDVDKSGIARKISDNVIRACYRKGLDQYELLQPDKVEKFEMEMYFNGYVFNEGHKIRIDITSSNYLEFFPNTNTGVNPYDDPTPIVATQKIYHGKTYPSHVKIPVLYGEI